MSTVSRISDFMQDWNDSNTSFVGIGLDVTDTGSAAGSRLLSLRHNGVQHVFVDKVGSMAIGGQVQAMGLLGDWVYLNPNWNNPAFAFKTVDVDITNTQSDAGSRPIEVKVDSVVVFSVDAAGTVFSNPVGDLTAAINARQLLSEKAQANGYAPLDAGAKVPPEFLSVSGGLNIKGEYNIVTNTPTLVDGTGTVGDTYWNTVAGTRDFGSGNKTVAVGDWLVYTDGLTWEVLQSFAPVNSVFGRTGIVAAQVGDYEAFYVQGPGSSVDTEIALFSGTTGRTLAGNTGITALPGRMVIQSAGIASTLELNRSTGSLELAFSYSEISSASQLRAINTRLLIQSNTNNVEILAPSGEVLTDKDPTSPLGVATKQYVDNSIPETIQDAPADNFIYGRINNQWVKVTQLAALRGVPTNFSPGSSPTVVAGWPDAYSSGIFSALPPVGGTGIINIPINGIYRITAKIVGEQSNSNKELSLLYWILSNQQADVVFDAMDVATDKTSWRTGGGSFLWQGIENEQLRIAVSWEGASIGTYQMDPCSFELEYLQDFQSFVTW